MNDQRDKHTIHDVISKAKQTSVNKTIKMYVDSCKVEIERLKDILANPGTMDKNETVTQIEVKLAKMKSRHNTALALREKDYKFFIDVISQYPNKDMTDLRNHSFSDTDNGIVKFFIVELQDTLRHKLEKEVEERLPHIKSSDDTSLVIEIIYLTEEITECMMEVVKFKTDLVPKRTDPNSFGTLPDITLNGILECVSEFRKFTNEDNMFKVLSLNAKLLYMRNKLEKRNENVPMDVDDVQNNVPMSALIDENDPSYCVEGTEIVKEVFESTLRRCFKGNDASLNKLKDKLADQNIEATVMSKLNAEKIRDEHIKLVLSQLQPKTFADFVDYIESHVNGVDINPVIIKYLQETFNKIVKEIRKKINEHVVKYDESSSPSEQDTIAINVASLNHYATAAYMFSQRITTRESYCLTEPIVSNSVTGLAVRVLNEYDVLLLNEKNSLFNCVFHQDAVLMGLLYKLKNIAVPQRPPLTVRPKPRLLPRFQHRIGLGRLSQSRSMSKPYATRYAVNQSVPGRVRASNVDLSTIFGSSILSIAKSAVVSDSLNNSIMGIESSSCINQECLLSHTLSELDTNNFGKFYTGKQSPTNIFPRICQHCLLAKFGLYEAFVEFGPFVNCVVKKSQKPNDNLAGPFLKAYKSIQNVSNRRNVVFANHTIILPSGQLLMEILMSSAEDLFNKDDSIPKILHGLEHLYLNTFMFGYFKHMHDVMTNPSSQREKPSQPKTLDEILWCENMTNSNHQLQATAEVDTMLMSQLIQPTGSLSKYVVSGESTILEDKRLVIAMFRKGSIVTQERATDKESAVVTIGIWNLSKDIYPFQIQKVQYLNQYLTVQTTTMRQLIVNRKLGLQNYFINSKDNSAIDLHISSFCFPRKIMEGDKTVQEYKPNCTFIPGIGLVSIGDICEGDLLIITRNVYLDKFTRLKMANYEDALRYNEINPKTTLSNHYEKEVRIPISKSCMYGNIS